MIPGLPPPFLHTASDQNWTVGRPGNEAIYFTTFYGHTCILLCLESSCGTDGVMFSAVWPGSPLVVTCDKLL